MKLSQLHETAKVRTALRRIYGGKLTGPERARVQQPRQQTAIDPGATVLQPDAAASGFATDAGIPVNPRHRKFFGIKEG